MSINIPTFTIPYYDENVKKLEPLVKAKNGLLSRFSDVFVVIIMPFTIILGSFALFALFSLLSVEGIPQASDGFPASIAISLIALFVLSLSLMASLFIHGGPYWRKVSKITIPIVKELDLVEKLEYWLKTNYGLRLSSRPGEVAQDLLINNALYPKNTIGLELYQDRDDTPRYFIGIFVEKSPGVFELQKASVSDTTESVYFTAIPETEREKVTS